MNLEEFRKQMLTQKLTQVQALRKANLASIMSVANATISEYHTTNAEDME